MQNPMYMSRRRLPSEQIYTKDFLLFPCKDKSLLYSQPHTSCWGLLHTPQFCFVPGRCGGEEKLEHLWAGKHMNNTTFQMSSISPHLKDAFMYHSKIS